jgi:hypothetical protein
LATSLAEVAVLHERRPEVLLVQCRVWALARSHNVGIRGNLEQNPGDRIIVCFYTEQFLLSSTNIMECFMSVDPRCSWSGVGELVVESPLTVPASDQRIDVRAVG